MENVLAIVEDLCRLCLNVPGVDNIFKPVDLTEDIFNILGIKIHYTDRLPQTLCKNCLNVINNAKNLRVISQKNNEGMKYLLGETCSNSDEQESNEEISKTLITVKKHKSPQANDGSDVESDVTVESLLKRKKRKWTSSTSHENIKYPYKCDQESNKKISKSLINVKKHESPQANDGSDVESDVTVESLLKRKKRKKECTSSTSDGNIKYPYKCDNCSKSFPTRKKLSLHSRVHNKTFVCPLDACEKTFACKNDLNKHIRCHTGEKPYQCDICDRKFTQKCLLRLHREKVHYEFDYNKIKALN